MVKMTMQWNIGKWLSNLKINWVKNDGLNQ